MLCLKILVFNKWFIVWYERLFFLTDKTLINNSIPKLTVPKSHKWGETGLLPIKFFVERNKKRGLFLGLSIAQRAQNIVANRCLQKTH